MNADHRRQQWGEAERWFVTADEGLRAARVLLNADPPLAPTAAYHCQQAAEKLMKGLLAAAAQPLQRTHDLDALAELASRAFPGLSEHLDFCRPLTASGTMFRYPAIETDAAMAPTVNEIDEAVRRLTLFRAAVATAAQREQDAGD